MTDLIPVLPVTALHEGDSAACQVGGRRVLLCLVEGRYYAVEALCPHAGQPLDHGSLEGFELVCPLHRARFDVRSGAVVKGPAGEGLATWFVVVEAGRICLQSG